MPNNKKCSNILGQSLENPQKEITHIDQITKGDHVVFRRLGYDHHVIVVDNDYDDTITIRHFDGPFPEGGRKARIVLVEKPFSDLLARESVHKVVYGRGEALSILEVLRNAERIQREFDEQGDDVTCCPRYNLFLDNCEHFAYECKTGQPKSVQVKNLAQTTAGLAANGVTDLVLLSLLEKTGAQIGGTVIGGLVETVLTCDDVNRFNEMLEKGRITEKEWEDAVVKRLVTAIGAVLGTCAGQAAGVYFGGPLGMWLGGLLGNVLGRCAGSIMGEGLVLSKDLVLELLARYQKRSHVE